MKRSIFKILTAATFIFNVLSSCYKDKGNYSYHPINEVTITSDKDYYTVFKFDSLKITAQIEQSIPDNGALKYDWAIYNSGAGDGSGIPSGLPETISTDRNLEVLVSQVPRKFAYDLVLTVTDTSTGVGFKHYYQLQVNAALSEGWMLLTSNGERGDVDFILPGDIVRHHVFSSVNPDKALPADVSLIPVLTGNGINFQFVLWNNGGYIMNKNTFEVAADFDQIFYRAPEALQPEGLISANFTNKAYAVNDGGVYSMALIYGAKKFGDRIPGQYNVAPYAINGIFQDVFLDLQHHKFIALETYGTSFNNFPPPSEKDAFDLSHVPGTLLTVQSTVLNQYIALFSSLDDDDIRIYTLAPRSDVVAAGFQKAGPQTLLSRATQFASSSLLPQIYFAIDNAIYLYDIAANASRKVYSFPVSEKLEILKMNGNSGLVASTYNGRSSNVYFFKLASTGNIENNKPERIFSGFEHIIDLNYKSR